MEIFFIFNRLRFSSVRKEIQLDEGGKGKTVELLSFNKNQRPELIQK